MVDKIGNPLAAANAYASTAKSGVSTATGGEDNANTAGTGASFGNMLEKAIQGSIDNVKAGEKASADAIVGKADLLDVTQAVTAAKMTIETVVAVRDEVVKAYERISSMPI